MMVTCPKCQKAHRAKATAKRYQCFPCGVTWDATGRVYQGKPRTKPPGTIANLKIGQHTQRKNEPPKDPPQTDPPKAKEATKWWQKPIW